jgi:hypothetical protein
MMGATRRSRGRGACQTGWWPLCRVWYCNSAVHSLVWDPVPESTAMLHSDGHVFTTATLPCVHWVPAARLYGVWHTCTTFGIGTWVLPTRWMMFAGTAGSVLGGLYHRRSVSGAVCPGHLGGAGGRWGHQGRIKGGSRAAVFVRQGFHAVLPR